MNSLYNSFTSDIFDNLSDLASTLNSFKDNFTDSPWAGHWVGVVLDNKDPEKLGRLKINVFGVYDSVTNQKNLPWAEPMEASMAGTSLIVPDIGALVNVYFENDELYFPKYTSKVPVNSVLKTSKVDVETDYPNTMVLFENANMSVQMNRVTGQTVFKHKSGMVIHFTGDSPTSSKDGKKTKNNSFEVLLSNGSTHYALKGGPEGFVITDGKTGDTLINLSDKGITQETKGKVGVQAGPMAGHVLDGASGMISTSPGLAIPDPSLMGPYNCIPICPFAGLPHTGNKYVATGKPTGALASAKKSAEKSDFSL